MPILHDNNKVTPELQNELATYGLVRDAAIKGVAKIPGKGPKLFGIREEADEFKLYFTNDLTRLDNLDDPMQVGMIAPDNESFDMLQTVDLTKDIGKDETSIRRYLSNLLDTL